MENVYPTRILYSLSEYFVGKGIQVCYLSDLSDEDTYNENQTIIYVYKKRNHIPNIVKRLQANYISKIFRIILFVIDLLISAIISISCKREIDRERGIPIAQFAYFTASLWRNQIKSVYLHCVRIVCVQVISVQSDLCAFF